MFGFPFGAPQFFPPPPYNHAWTLQKKRQKLIESGMKGGLTAKDIYEIADREVPLSDIEKAETEYAAKYSNWKREHDKFIGR